MLVRRSVPLLLAGVLAAAGCEDVEQRDPAPVLVLAGFSPAQSMIPLPNDLALRAAPLQPDPPRTALLGLITAGGYPNVIGTDAWAPLAALPYRGVYIPVRAEAFDEGSGAYAPTVAPTELDPATLNGDTIAIVRLDGDTHTPLTPAVVQYFNPQPGLGFLVLRPSDSTAPLFPVGRYVVALRGGANGVHAIVGGESVPLEADRPIALVAPNKDLSRPENQPPGGLEPAQVAQLEGLRQSLAFPVDWTAITDEATCRAGVPIPPAGTHYGLCWLPAPSGNVIPAFAGVDVVFPHEEIASIQTFEVFNAVPALQDEVTP